MLRFGRKAGQLLGAALMLASGAGLANVAATSAHADPSWSYGLGNSAKVLTGVGSDTIEDVLAAYNGEDNGLPYPALVDANHFTITRSLDAPVDRVWEIIGNPGASPGRGVDVRVERTGAADGTGLVRVVKVGLATIHEEITDVGPGHVGRYRMTKGAPVRDYTSSVVLEESPDGGTLVSWDARFRPVVPGTG